MAKLTKKQYDAFGYALRQLEMAESFIMRDDVAIMKKHNLSSSDAFTSSYYEGERFFKVTKEAGSEFVGLHLGIEALKWCMNEYSRAHAE